MRSKVTDQSILDELNMPDEPPMEPVAATLPRARPQQMPGFRWDSVRQSLMPQYAMNAEEVPLGTGEADQAQDLMTLQKQYQEALANDDFERAEQIKQQMQQMAGSRRTVG